MEDATRHSIDPAQANDPAANTPITDTSTSLYAPSTNDDISIGPDGHVVSTTHQPEEDMSANDPGEDPDQQAVNLDQATMPDDTSSQSAGMPLPTPVQAPIGKTAEATTPAQPEGSEVSNVTSTQPTPASSEPAEPMVPASTLEDHVAGGILSKVAATQLVAPPESVPSSELVAEPDSTITTEYTAPDTSVVKPEPAVIPEPAVSAIPPVSNEGSYHTQQLDIVPTLGLTDSEDEKPAGTIRMNGKLYDSATGAPVNPSQASE